MNHIEFLKAAENSAWQNLQRAAARNDLFWVSFYSGLLQDIHLLSTETNSENRDIQM